MIAPTLQTPQADSGSKPGVLEGGDIRLNLGGRTHSINGFTTVDLFPGSDVEKDVSDLSDFKDGSVSEIYASHILEHFSLRRTEEVLREWRRVLKPMAKAYIAVPSFEAAIQLYQKTGMTELINHLLWGDQEYPLAFHYSGFTFPSLSIKLIRAGFRDVRKIKDMPYALGDCSTLVDTHYHIPLSLNVEATA